MQLEGRVGEFGGARCRWWMGGAVPLTSALLQKSVYLSEDLCRYLPLVWLFPFLRGTVLRNVDGEWRWYLGNSQVFRNSGLAGKALLRGSVARVFEQTSRLVNLPLGIRM
jgi:hypothetical protein